MRWSKKQANPRRPALSEKEIHVTFQLKATQLPLSIAFAIALAVACGGQSRAVPPQCGTLLGGTLACALALLHAHRPVGCDLREEMWWRTSEQKMRSQHKVRWPAAPQHLSLQPSTLGRQRSVHEPA